MEKTEVEFHCGNCNFFSWKEVPELDDLKVENARLREALEKIAFETQENSNFSRSEDEAQYYINVAKEALSQKDPKA